MFINGRFVSLRAPNNGNDSTGGGADNSTPPADPTPGADNGGKKDGGDKTPDIPYVRFKEVNDENKAIKAKLAEFEKKEAEANEAKKKAAEEESLKKGEYEKILSEKNAEIETHKSEKDSWEKKTASIKALVDVKLKEIESTRGEETLAKVKTAIGSDDPWIILEKLDSILSLMGSESRPTGGQNHPLPSGGDSQLSALKEKFRKEGRLTPDEEKIFYEHLTKLDQ